MTVTPARAEHPIVAALTKNSRNIAEALPKHLDERRFLRLALTTMRKTPALQQCNPDSFIGALLTASSLGLEPDVNGECYLVPYKGEATLIIGYQGLSKLFWQHPLAARLSAEYVCERDDFSYDKGLVPVLHHRPAAGDRGKVVAYYAIVGLKNGATWFDVFTPAQIAALRGPVRKGNIADPEHWMERKTALKQVIKLAPKATEMTQALLVDERTGTELSAAGAAKAITQGEALHELPPAHIDPETGEVHEAELVEAEQVQS